MQHARSMDASPRELLAVTHGKHGKRLRSGNGTVTHGRRLHTGNGTVTHGKRLLRVNGTMTKGRRLHRAFNRLGQ